MYFSVQVKLTVCTYVEYVFLLLVNESTSLLGVLYCHILYSTHVTVVRIRNVRVCFNPLPVHYAIANIRLSFVHLVHHVRVRTSVYVQE